MDSDKKLEQARYDQRGLSLTSDLNYSLKPFGKDTLALSLQEPYNEFERLLSFYAPQSEHILELGSGTGEYTKNLLVSRGTVVATDISSNSLEVLLARFSNHPNLFTKVADIEHLPFPDNSFDLVVAAGALSYGDNSLVLDEIHRVLSYKGRFICVDSLNHNPIYRLNRLFHYLKGNRSLSTLSNMPTIELLDQYRLSFSHVSCSFYGLFSWLSPLLEFALRPKRAKVILDKLDCFFKVNKNAFKFIMVALK